MLIDTHAHLDFDDFDNDRDEVVSRAEKAGISLIINPGSPTKPKAPPAKRGFDKPFARPSVITLIIDEDDFLTTFIINLKI